MVVTDVTNPFFAVQQHSNTKVKSELAQVGFLLFCDVERIVSHGLYKLLHSHSYIQYSFLMRPIP